MAINGPHKVGNTSAWSGPNIHEMLRIHQELSKGIFYSSVQRMNVSSPVEEVGFVNHENVVPESDLNNLVVGSVVNTTFEQGNLSCYQIRLVFKHMF